MLYFNQQKVSPTPEDITDLVQVLEFQHAYSKMGGLYRRYEGSDNFVSIFKVIRTLADKPTPLPTYSGGLTYDIYWLLPPKAVAEMLVPGTSDLFSSFHPENTAHNHLVALGIETTRGFVRKKVAREGADVIQDEEVKN